MTCLLFFKEKIQDNYSYFEITLKLNKSLFIIHIFHYIHIFLQTGYICEGKRDIVVHSVIKNVIVDRNNNQKRSYKRQKKVKEVEIIYTVEVKYYEIYVSHI